MDEDFLDKVGLVSSFIAMMVSMYMPILFFPEGVAFVPLCGVSAFTSGFFLRKYQERGEG